MKTIEQLAGAMMSSAAIRIVELLRLAASRLGLEHDRAVLDAINQPLDLTPDAVVIASLRQACREEGISEAKFVSIMAKSAVPDQVGAGALVFGLERGLDTLLKTKQRSPHFNDLVNCYKTARLIAMGLA